MACGALQQLLKAMTPTKLNQVFPSFEAVHVASKEDIIFIHQGSATITIPSALVAQLIDALELAHRGDL